MPKTSKRKQTTDKSTVDLLVQMMNDMNTKLHSVHKEVTKNSKDVADLREQMALGKGGVKVLVWVIGIATTLISVWKFFFWDK